MDELIDCDTHSTDSPHVTEVFTARGKIPTESEMDLLFENLSCASTKPAILSLISKFSDAYVPKSLYSNFPQPLKSLKQPSYMELDYLELLAICEC